MAKLSKCATIICLALLVSLCAPGIAGGAGQWTSGWSLANEGEHVGGVSCTGVTGMSTYPLNAGQGLSAQIAPNAVTITQSWNVAPNPCGGHTWTWMAFLRTHNLPAPQVATETTTVTYSDTLNAGDNSQLAAEFMGSWGGCWPIVEVPLANDPAPPAS